MAVYYQMSYCQLLLSYMCNIHTVFLPICPLYHNNVLKKVQLHTGWLRLVSVWRHQVACAIVLRSNMVNQVFHGSGMEIPGVKEKNNCCDNTLNE